MTVTPATTPAERLAGLRARTGTLPQAEFDRLWADLPTAHTDQLRGLWQGGLFDTGHPHNRRPGVNPWYGKYFASTNEAWPDVYRTSNGDLQASGSRGSLWMVEFRGELTAALVYDEQPVLDHFKAVGPDSLLGVMDRSQDREADVWLYFWLDRIDPAPQVTGLYQLET
jgi:hypothetical protein